MLKNQGLSFSSDRLYDKDKVKHFGSKKAVIEHIQASLKIDSSIFIDDSYQHTRCFNADSNVSVLIPNWGYVSPSALTQSEQEICTAIDNFFNGNS